MDYEFADNHGEAVKIAFVLFVGIDFLLVCLDLFFQFPLFRFLACPTFRFLRFISFSVSAERC
ncbi:hypothetical protein AALA90_02970 [Lachnospiraceae bacterium 38-10]